MMKGDIVSRVSEIIVQTLKSKGVDTIFGIPSVHNIGFYDALLQEKSIRHILCRHESSATHMADGYARSGRKLGVVVTSTGPGATYTVSPLQEAFYSCSPVLMLTSNIPTDYIGKGRGFLHELNNQDSLFREITKTAVCLRSEKGIRDKVERVIDSALSGRPGPVYLEVPVDLWDMEAGDQETAESELAGSEPGIPGFEETIQLLHNAKRPIIVAGIEALHAGLEGVITELAEVLYAPVVTDFSAKGIVPEDHPLAFGSAIRRGVVREIQKTCDLTISIGSRLRNVDFFRRNVKFPGLIHIDWDNNWIDRNYKAERTLIGNVKDITATLTEHLRLNPPTLSHKEEIHGFREKLEQERSQIPDLEIETKYVDILRNVLPRNGSLVVDNTILGYMAEQLYTSYKPGGIMAAKGATPIGFAFSAAIGAKLANPSIPVVALTGDGGFLYGAQELATCIRHDIGFPVIIVNDNEFKMIDYLQQNSYRRGHETSLVNPDFAALAGSFGVSSVTVDSPDGLAKALEKALSTKRMELIELKAAFPDPPFLKY